MVIVHFIEPLSLIKSMNMVRQLRPSNSDWAPLADQRKPSAVRNVRRKKEGEESYKTLDNVPRIQLINKGNILPKVSIIQI